MCDTLKKRCQYAQDAVSVARVELLDCQCNPFGPFLPGSQATSARITTALTSRGQQSSDIAWTDDDTTQHPPPSRQQPRSLHVAICQNTVGVIIRVEYCSIRSAGDLDGVRRVRLDVSFGLWVPTRN